MRALAMATLALGGACDDGSGAAEVNVHIAASGGVPAFEGIQNVRMGDDGRWEGHIASTAVVSITTTWQFGHDNGSDTRRLEGLLPGDEIEISSTALYDLPADCTCGASSDPAIGLVVRSTSCGYPTCPPPTPNQGTTTTSLLVYREAGTTAAGPDDILVRCSATTWDELRPSFAVSRTATCP